MTKTINKGRSFLNAADETANPYGLILSEEERRFIYGELNCLDNITNALLYGRTGWKQQVSAAVSTVAQFTGVCVAAIVLHRFADASTNLVLGVGLALLILQKLDLLLTHEKIDDTHARRQREDKREAKERAMYFKDITSEDTSLE